MRFLLHHLADASAAFFGVTQISFDLRPRRVLPKLFCCVNRRAVDADMSVLLMDMLWCNPLFRVDLHSLVFWAWYFYEWQLCIWSALYTKQLMKALFYVEQFRWNQNNFVLKIADGSTFHRSQFAKMPLSTSFLPFQPSSAGLILQIMAYSSYYIKQIIFLCGMFSFCWYLRFYILYEAACVNERLHRARNFWANYASAKAKNYIHTYAAVSHTHT
jgi:hypothetical protein